MLRAAPLAIVLALVLAGTAAAAGSGDFQYGVTSAEVTTSSALLWTRAPAAGPVTVTVAGKKVGLTADPAHDLTVQASVRGLKPGTRYTYFFAQNGATSERGHFVTAPRSSSRAPVRFTWSGDADAQPPAPGAAPFWGDFGTYARMAAAKGAFAINLGDTIYSDTEVGASVSGGVFQPSAPTALTLDDKRAKYRMNLGQAALRKLRAATSVFNQWDDHEFINDFTRGGPYDQIYPAGVQAFLEYMPARYTQALGLYRHVRWGRNLELFFPDERSFRSPKADQACINPQSGAPDLAPTAPATLRSVFSLAVPSLSAPVSASCLATLADPSRSFIGAKQLAMLVHDLKASKATFKVIVNELPLMELYLNPYDTWQGYAGERAKFLSAVRKVRNIVVLTTDQHATFVRKVDTDTLGKPKHSGITEVVTGPVGTATYGDEIDQAVGQAGAYKQINSLFLKGSLGLTCSNLNQDSFGRVDVSAKRLVIHLLTDKGKPVRDSETGPACKPVSVRAAR